MAYTEKAVRDSWLPLPVATGYAHLIPWIEAVVCVWLLIGYRLRAGWVVAALYTVSLGFGMMVAPRHANDYLHVLLCVAGLYLADADRYGLDAPRRAGATRSAAIPLEH